MKKSEREYAEVDLASIVSASENIRDTAPRLSKGGFLLFKAGSQPSLKELALSKNATEQARFVKLIEEDEPSIKELADNMATTGQLEPIRVRPTENKNEYDLVFGARRTLARLYIYAKSAGKIQARITAEIAEQEGKDALYASISENIREAPSPMDEARSYERLRKSFGMSAKEIGDAMGRSAKGIQVRLKLLKLPKELQEKVHMGKIGIERALKHLDEPVGNKEKTSHKAPSLREIEKLYAAAPDDLTDELRPLITEEVRQLFAHWLGVAYKPRPQEQSA